MASRERGSILLYAVAAIAILGILSGIAYKIRGSGKDAIRLEWAEANRLQREKEAKQIAKADEKKEKGDVKAKVVYRTITQTVDKYIDRPIYRNLCFDADGLRDANAALRNPLATPGKPDKPMPGLIPALRWDRSLSIAKAD